jgi:hypothetical protein
MTALADVLEAIHTSHRRFRAVRASGVFAGRPWRMWWAWPRYVRTEENADDGVRVIVQAGDWWWIREGGGRGHTNEGDPHHGVGFGPGLELLHTRPLLGSTLLELQDEAVVAGRRAAILRATPRPDGDFGRWWGTGDPFEVAIDLERGIALRAHGVEMNEVMFDEEFDASVFASPLSPDEPIETTARRPREVLWDEAFDLVGFAVRLPRSLPDGARPTHCLVSANDPPGWIGHSWVIDPGGRYRLSIRQGPDLAEQAGRDDRTLITRDGVEFRVEEYRGEGFRTEIVACELDGAWFEISSNLPLQAILDVVLSIGPVA